MCQEPTAATSGSNDRLGDRIIVDYRHYVRLVNERDRLKDFALDIYDAAGCYNAHEPTDFTKAAETQAKSALGIA